VRRIALTDIARIDVVRGWGAPIVVGVWGIPMWNEHWCNFTPSRFLVLRRRSGWIRNVIVNPRDTAGFLEILRREAPGIEQG
jgi:hypothetical protein